MKRNVQTTNCRHSHSRSGGFVIRQHRVSGFVIRLSLLFLMMTLGVTGMWGQTHPFILTDADVTAGTETLYWIESNGATGFYMIPHTNNSNVSTTNMPNLKALWYFMDAGIDNSIQYYYIVNYNTGYYLKLDGTIGNDNTIKIASFGSGGDSFKFSIGGSEGHWIFYPKSGNGNYWVNKKSSNVPYDKYLKSSNYGGSPDANSKWNFVAKNSVTWAHPFTNSTNSEKHYYTIHNATANGAAYYMSTDDDSPPYATISSDVDDDKKVWFFVEAASDNSIPNFKYYYIVNALTGKYLKFIGSANGSLQANSLQIFEHTGSETGNTEANFQFMVLNAKGDTYSAFSIMPKSEINYYYNKSASLSPGNASGNDYSDKNAITLSNGMKIGIYNDRGQNNNYAHWKFESIDPCADPTFGIDLEIRKLTLSSTTTGSSIYYTSAEGSEPTDPTRASNLYSSGITLTENASTTIKAVAVKNGNARSNVVTKTVIYMPTITLAGGPFTYDGEAQTPSISSVMVGETPVSAEDYDISYENNTNAGTATVTIREKTGNETIIYGTVNFTISKANITPTVSITGWTYGTPNDPSVSGNTGNGSVTYKYKVKGADDETYSEEKPEDAGTYLVKAIIAESTNYNGATTEPVEFTISKADFNPTVSITGWTYGGSANSPSLSGIPGSVTVTYMYKLQGADDGTYSTEVPTNAGNYTVQATIAETANYNGSAATANFTITPKSLTSSDITLNITRSGSSYTVTVEDGNDTLNEGVGNDYTLGSTGDSSTKYYVATIGGVNNYTGSVSAKFVNVDFHPNSANTEWTSSFVIGTSEGAFATPTGYTAHIVTGVSGNVVTAPSLSYIPEGAPVILLSTASSNGFMAQPTSGAAPDVTGNKLAVASGTDVERTFTAGQIYILYNGEFVLNAAGTLAAGKIYLPKSVIVSDSTPAPSRLFIDWGESTGLNNSQLSTLNSPLPVVWYTLDGRRLNGKPMKKGLYLRNGQKIVVR